MEKDIEITKVVFRKWRGIIIALFPEIQSHGLFCESYMHIGQHGGANYDYVVQQSIPATATEYADLQQELESIGYNLKIYQRCRVNFGG